MLPPPVPVRIARPVPGPAPGRGGFPLVATLAPVGVSVAIWAVTGSLFSLLFAGLGPVVALAGLVDGRRQRRRDARRDRERLAEEESRLAARVDQLNERERVRRAAETAPMDPDAMAGWAVERWAREAWATSEIVIAPLPVRLGTADTDGVAELTGDSSSSEFPTLLAAPLLADARDGIGLLGPDAACRSVARSLVLQLAAVRSPARARIVVPASELSEWAAGLPHAVAVGPDGVARLEADGEPDVRVAWGEPLPPGCGLVLRVSGPDGAVLERAAGDGSATAIRPWAVTTATARGLAAELARVAGEHGIRAARHTAPQRVDRAELGDAPTGRGLETAIGHDGAGPVVVDLVADGPHALIGGTTGSGKSELLVSWVLGMAAARPAVELTFLLIDFKGGAAFSPLGGLPHVVGILSDLDAAGTRRAIDSLRAELLRREHLLASQGARSIEELEPGRLARLVIVVDEFAAMVGERPELHEVFADLAARGRSLGLHLVLCTQRPSGVIRDAVLANVTLRIGLRMTDRADSIALVGSDVAARLPADPRGRAVLATEEGPREFQVAIAGPNDVARLRAPAPPGLVRPWREPLAPVIALDDLERDGDGDGIPFGRVDLPAEQRQPVARFRPREHGHLLGLGDAGSGKSTLLRALGASSDAGLIPSDPADAWGAVTAALAPRTSSRTPRLLLFDDLDLLLARFDADARHDFAELLARLLREAPGGLALAATAQRLGGPLHEVSGLFGSRVLLRHATREEHVLAGGSGPGFDPDRRPGAGQWRGAEIQVAFTERSVPPFEPAVPRVALEPGAVLAVVSGRPRELTGRLRAAGARVLDVDDPERGSLADARPIALVGDPDAWQADWALLTRARREWPIVLERCSAADLRAVARVREAPPPLRPGDCWLVEDGGVRRARWDL